ncbi:pyrroloquinoline quinone biosynthesis peptide chaperone PqqD [Marinobacterium aestuariivivens]|uniref:Pyrroloquinoline quinone biosynthesis peptide chaperone PqqD n=1 Tax=Marinobacterium aestuariivivens TaxID=1698799 RepID=A0ABW1ZVG3_9GAMM
MTQDRRIRLDARYVVRPPFLFRWEASQDAHLLLYPEGIVKLNATGGTILGFCDGKHTVTELIAALTARYDSTDSDAITNSVLNFLEVSRDKGWIQPEA